MKTYKLMSGIFYAIFIGFLVGVTMYFAGEKTDSFDYDSKINTKNVEMSVSLDERYKIVNATIDTYELKIILLDTKTGELYESPLDLGSIEDFGHFVCELQYYNKDGSYRQYDCSTPEKTLESIIMELGYETVELIEEG